VKKTCVVSYFSKDFLTIEFNHFQSPMDNGDCFRFPLKKTLKKKAQKGKKNPTMYLSFGTGWLIILVCSLLCVHLSTGCGYFTARMYHWKQGWLKYLFLLEGEHTDCLHEALWKHFWWKGLVGAVKKVCQLDWGHVPFAYCICWVMVRHSVEVIRIVSKLIAIWKMQEHQSTSLMSGLCYGL
jgi:hypothetical protein